MSKKSLFLHYRGRIDIKDEVFAISPLYTADSYDSLSDEEHVLFRVRDMVRSDQTSCGSGIHEGIFDLTHTVNEPLKKSGLYNLVMKVSLNYSMLTL